MNHLFLIVRILGFLLALLFACFAYLTISGINASEEVPPLADRIASSLPLVLTSLLLLAPQELFVRGRAYWFMAAAYLFSVAFFSYVVLRDLPLYRDGAIHGAAVVFGLLFLGIVICNGLVLVAKRHMLPNNSFKPTPLRGAA